MPPHQNAWVPGGVLEGFARRFPGISGQKEWFAIGWPKSAPDGAIRRGQRDILPDLAWLSLAWLSLAGLLASRTRLRFTRQIHQAKCRVSDEFLPFHSGLIKRRLGMQISRRTSVARKLRLLSAPPASCRWTQGLTTKLQASYRPHFSVEECIP